MYKYSLIIHSFIIYLLSALCQELGTPRWMRQTPSLWWAPDLLGTTNGHNVVSAKRAACPGVLGTLRALQSARKFSKRQRKDSATDVVCWGRGAGWQDPSLLPRRWTECGYTVLIHRAECDKYYEKLLSGNSEEGDIMTWMLFFWMVRENWDVMWSSQTSQFIFRTQNSGCMVWKLLMSSKRAPCFALITYHIFTKFCNMKNIKFNC